MSGLYQTPALAVLGGVLLASGFWPEAPFAWAGWIALVPFFWIIYGRTPRSAFLWSWLYGTAAWMAGVYWMPGPLAHYLKIPALAGWIIFILLWGFHGLVFALAGWLTAHLGKRLESRIEGPLAWSAAAVPLLVAGEGFFPMLLPPVLAYTQHTHLPQLQSLELFGTAGLAWLLSGFNAALFCVLRMRQNRRAWAFFLGMAGLALCNEGYGILRIAAVTSQISRAQRRTALLVQPALPPGAARTGPSALSAQKLLTEKGLSSEEFSLVVWPESTFGYVLENGALIAGEPAGVFLKKYLPYPVSMLMNTRATVPGGENGGPVRGYNSAFLKGPSGEFLGLVKKQILFPFGEFMPGGEFLPFLYRLSPRTYALSSGGAPRLLEAPGAARLGVLICYEDLKPELARAYSKMGADLLVNLTEDMLLGEAGARQHMIGSISRAIENRKFLLRCANFGTTCVVDPVGRVVARLPAGTPDTLRAPYASLPGTTPYASLGRLFYFLSIPAFLFLAWKTR